MDNFDRAGCAALITAMAGILFLPFIPAIFVKIFLNGFLFPWLSPELYIEFWQTYGGLALLNATKGIIGGKTITNNATKED